MANRQINHEDDILHIGIDLGTSRSAICASNGKEVWVESFVGWPKDFVAKKMLGRDVLFGKDAVDNRLSLNLVRPLENGVIRDGTERDEEAVRELIHHLLTQVGATEHQRIHAAIGVPAEALRVNKVSIRDAAREYADALMVVSEPFAVAYGENSLNSALIIDIGAGTLDFCVMHGTMPTEEDQRSLVTAGDYVDRHLFERLQERHPEAKFSFTQVRHLKEQHGFVGEPSNRVRVKVPINNRMGEVDVTDELRQACESLLPVIVESVVDLLSRYEPDFQDQVRRNLYIAGGGSEIDGIAEAVEDALSEYGSFKVTAVSDTLFSGARGALALAKDMPEEYWEDM